MSERKHRLFVEFELPSFYAPERYAAMKKVAKGGIVHAARVEQHPPSDEDEYADEAEKLRPPHRRPGPHDRHLRRLPRLGPRPRGGAMSPEERIAELVDALREILSDPDANGPWEGYGCLDLDEAREISRRALAQEFGWGQPGPDGEVARWDRPGGGFVTHITLRVDDLDRGGSVEIDKNHTVVWEVKRRG